MREIYCQHHSPKIKMAQTTVNDSVIMIGKLQIKPRQSLREEYGTTAMLHQEEERRGLQVETDLFQLEGGQTWKLGGMLALKELEVWPAQTPCHDRG